MDKDTSQCYWIWISSRSYVPADKCSNAGSFAVILTVTNCPAFWDWSYL